MRLAGRNDVGTYLDPDLLLRSLRGGLSFAYKISLSLFPEKVTWSESYSGDGSKRGIEAGSATGKAPFSFRDFRQSRRGGEKKKDGLREMGLLLRPLSSSSFSCGCTAGPQSSSPSPAAAALVTKNLLSQCHAQQRRRSLDRKLEFFFN